MVAVTITIRRVALKDAAAIAQYMAEPAVFGGLLQMPHSSEETWAKRLVDMAALGHADLMLVAELDGAVVASGGLHAFGSHVRSRHVMGLGMSVALDAGCALRGSGARRKRCSQARGRNLCQHVPNLRFDRSVARAPGRAERCEPGAGGARGR